MRWFSVSWFVISPETPAHNLDNCSTLESSSYCSGMPTLAVSASSRKLRCKPACLGQGSQTNRPLPGTPCPSVPQADDGLVGVRGPRLQQPLPSCPALAANAGIGQARPPFSRQADQELVGVLQCAQAASNRRAAPTQNASSVRQDDGRLVSVLWAARLAAQLAEVEHVVGHIAAIVLTALLRNPGVCQRVCCRQPAVVVAVQQAPDQVLAWPKTKVSV